MTTPLGRRGRRRRPLWSLLDASAARKCLSYFQLPLSYRMMFFIRADGEPSRITDAVRAALREIAPGFPMYEVATMEWRVGATLSYARAATTLLAPFRVGRVDSRDDRHVWRDLVRGRATQTRDGRAPRAGRDLPRSHTARRRTGTRARRAGPGLRDRRRTRGDPRTAQMLYDVAPTDPTTYAGIVGVLTVAIVLASLVPARRAAGVPAMSVLRTD